MRGHTHQTAKTGEPHVLVEDVTRHFKVSGGPFRKTVSVHALDRVSLTVHRGEVLGLVGESGSGKSTLARVILGLSKPERGRVEVEGLPVYHLQRKPLKALRRRMQIVFQDPFSALDPLMPLGKSVLAPLDQHRIGTKGSRRSRVVELLTSVGLDRSFVRRLPRDGSGGQLQRVVIARALALEPDLLICDEPTAALDASVRSQILNLINDVHRQLGLTIVMISHDLRVVRFISDRVAVMYLGQIVEIAPRDGFFDDPLHPYSRLLLEATLSEQPGTPMVGPVVRGEPPSPIDPPSGCRFHPRCPLAVELCRQVVPVLEDVEPGRSVACHRWQESRLENHLEAAARGAS